MTAGSRWTGRATRPHNRRPTTYRVDVGNGHSQAVNRSVAAINLAASFVTLVPVVGAVGLIVLSVLQQPAVALAAALLTALAGLVVIGRRALVVGVRARSNARTAPLLRAALVAIAEASRDLALRDPARGAPSADAMAVWSPRLGAVDRALRRVDFEQECLSYLIWLIAEVRRASEALRKSAGSGRPWRDEWLVVRDRVSLLACLLVGEANRRGAKDISTSFAGNPFLNPPADYGDRTMTAANDSALRGAPPFPTDRAFSPCTPERRGGWTDRVRPDSPLSFDQEDRRGLAIAKGVAVTVAVVGSYLLGTVIAFWLVAIFTAADPSYAWTPAATIVACMAWPLVYATTAVLGGVSYTWAAWSELEDAVLHLDAGAASGAPILSAVVAWWAAIAVGAGVGALGGQPEVAAAVAFGLVNALAALRLIASRA